MKYYNSFLSSNKEFPAVNAESIRQYDRKLLTEKLAEVFVEILINN